MSHLSRKLKKQRRYLKTLESTAFVILVGFGRDKLIVFPSVSTNSEESSHLSTIYQQEIDSVVYQDIKSFDAFHSADIESSILYFGKFIKRFQQTTRAQLVNLGKCWRERVSREHPDAKVWIVVHYNEEDDSWFLDTFNWDISNHWHTKPEHTIWF